LAHLTIDGTEYALYDAEPADTTNYQSFVTHKVINLTAASHTIKIQYRSESTSAYCRIRNARIVAIPLNGFYKDDDQDTQVSVTTTESAKASLTFNATAGNYLLIATAEPRPYSTSYSIYARFKVDGVAYDEDLQEGQDTTNYFTFGAMRVVSLSAGSHTLTITAQSEYGAMYIRRPRLVAIPLAAFEYYYAESETQNYTTSASFLYKTTLDFTPSSQADCMVLTTARYKGSSESYSPEVRMTIDYTSYGDCPLEPQDTTDYATFASLKVINLSSANHHIQVDYRSENTAATTYIKNSRIVVIKF
jgi:head-tail adaptor